MKTAHSKFINRELSWLEFNQRVLDEALDPSVPLLERLNFLSITGSNLDEFFMVRAGELELLIAGGIVQRDPAGLTPWQQLSAVHDRARRMAHDQYRCLEGLAAALAREDLVRLGAADLDPAQRDYVAAHFRNELYPVLTPMAVRAGDEFFPLLANLGLYLAVRLAPAAAGGEPRFAVVPLGRPVQRVVPVPSEHRHSYLFVEDIVALFAGSLFPGETVDETAAFRITRNAAMNVADELAADLMQAMESILAERRASGCVRLEIGTGASEATRGFLRKVLGLRPESVYALPGSIDLTAQRALTGLPGFEGLHYKPWVPQPTPDLDLTRSLFETLARRTVLLAHPYESFEPVVRFVEEAARDPQVLAIKQVLYRVSAGSPIIEALRAAAENGKYVTVVVELKARFDEARNIHWARALEEAGAQVIYGIKGLKTHAKVCLVVRREPRGLVRYCHFGTGNYNDRTARLYADIGLLTSDPELGADASAFFNAICGFSKPQEYARLSQSPIGLRERVVALIRGEAQRSTQGQKGMILAKMNALVDPEIIEELYRASQAGVDIRLGIRGACCLRPGVKGLSENIRVTSVVDRYLEHARIFCFHQDGAPQVFISSADWMPRNLNRRIELLVPVDDPACKRRLLRILETSLADAAKARLMQPDGRYKPAPGAAGVRRGSQEILQRWAREAADEARRTKRTVFEPHRPRRTPPGGAAL